ncbi:MAG: hypothetical protein A4E53_00083 [Pelotomaculum sp. PtaB.Bin104]|nr:MAG: hypothetical protein A4E53_00083 [Pelotomaculum sp. PtaB.Bin104]
MSKKKAKKKNSKIAVLTQANSITKKQPVQLFSDQFHTTTNFYRNNLAALKSHYPELAKQVEQCSFTKRYRVIPSLKQDLTPNLFCAEKDLLYYENADPLQDTKNKLADLQLKNAKIALCLGVGLGYEILYFFTDFAKDARTNEIIIIEKELEIFKLACCYTDLSPIISNPKIRLFIGMERDSLYVQFKKHMKANGRFLFLRALKTVYHPSSLHLDKEYYLGVMRIFCEASGHAVLDFGNSPEDSLIGIENMLANLSVIISNPGINNLFGRFQGKPAIVVATGPSLNKNKHLLKGLENRALIISVDASLKLLLEMGIRPHLVTSLERVIEVMRLLKDIPPSELENVYYAACPVIRREAYDVYSGPKIIVYRGFDHFNWLGIDRGMLTIKGSAGNMAFRVADALGCDPIILVGQDLAFSHSGISHAEGHVFGEKHDYLYKERIYEVPGNDGQPIMTSQTLYDFLKSYEVDVSEYTGTCVNATEGGAFIQGTLVMPLSEAIDRYLQNEFNPLDIIRQHLPKTKEEEIEETVKQVLAKVDRTAAELKRIKTICEESISIIGQAEPDLNVPNGSLPPHIIVNEILHRIFEKKRLCSSNYETFQLFFMHVMQSFNIKFEIEIHAIGDKHDTEVAEMAEIILKHREWFDTIGRLADVCHDTLLKYRTKLSFEFPNIKM